MIWDGERELFAGLAAQAAPERPGGARPRLRMAERRQVELRAISLEELVEADHRVRLVWSFVEGLDLSSLHETIKAVEGRPGHPPADPRLLVALWLYATVEGVGSAREVARLCAEHIAFQWLCGGVGMNAKTLADFRVAHGAVLERLLVDSFAALLKVGAARLDRVAQDGVRVRASAGAASFRRHSTLEACQRDAEEAVDRLRAEAERDPGAPSRRHVAARRRAAEDRARRVEAALAVSPGRCMPSNRIGPAGRPSGHPRRRRARRTRASRRSASRRRSRAPRPPTAQARVMKMADGGFRPAYNVQFASDTLSGAVAGVAVDNSGSDMGKMAPMNDALADRYGTRPREHLADGGYAKLDDIAALAEAGVVAYVPVPTPRDGTRDRYAPQPADPPAIAAWRERMGGASAKAIYKERAATAECVNAQARNRGLKQFLVRGIDKAKAIAMWHGLTHNMVCSWRLTTT